MVGYLGGEQHLAGHFPALLGLKMFLEPRDLSLEEKIFNWKNPHGQILPAREFISYPLL